MSLKCVVIDEVPAAIELLARYIENYPVLKLLGSFTDVVTGGQFLVQNSVDLLFIEAGMADHAAISLVNSLREKLIIIFTVGCDQIPKEVLGVQAVDYLVKPFSAERFSQSIFKATAALENKSPTDTIYIRSEYQLISVHLDEIEYIESMENYIRIHLQENKTLMTLMPLRAIIEKLPREKFVRIHRSYIIAIDKIRYVSSRKIALNSTELPVGLSYVEGLREVLGN